MSNNPRHFDALVIGCGAAGMSLALQLSDSMRVAVLSKNSLTESSTAYAQGGIAAAVDKSNDSPAIHATDTINAGAGLCNLEVVNAITNLAPEAVHWLFEQGLSFAKEPGTQHSGFHLNQEGGHSQRRVLHSKDATGLAIMRALLDRIRSRSHITCFPHQTVIDLIVKDNRCYGAYVLDNHSGVVNVFQAAYIVLATGGASKVYFYTSNPDGASGDGIAMGYRAGCEVTHMEFNQFHPTCLYHPQAKSFLLTEALRGEGAKIVLADGSRFFDRHHPLGELAPRDIVARAIDYEMKHLGIPCVYLDMRHRSKAFISSHFPNVYARCLSLGFDLSKSLVPIVPAAHYTCGGIKTDLQGRTDVKRLYAVGEVACTGLHGANRLASNSLLECVVMGGRLAKHIQQLWAKIPEAVKSIKLPAWDASRVVMPKERITIRHSWNELRQLMWNYVGIVRNEQQLLRAKSRIHLLKADVDDYYCRYQITKDLIELRNLVQVAELIVDAALARKQSCGLHYLLS